MEHRLILLLFSGVVVMECAMVHHHHHHFVFVDKSMTWKEAQQYCREIYNTDLATIGNMEDVQMMRTSAKGYSWLAWMGLHQSGEPSWKWSLAEEGSYNLEDTGFTAWSSGEPSGGDQEKCGFMSNRGPWFDHTCESPFYTMCYNESTTSYVPVKDERRSWRAAQSYCREHHTDLASVRNQEEHEEIKKLVGGVDFWIGLYRDDWVWSDQSKTSFRYWKPNRPDNQGNDNCAAAKLTEKGRWVDRKCTPNKYPFFCRKDDLMLVSMKLTWREAFAHCDELNMYLVSIFSEETQQRVMEVAKAASTPQVWVGLRYLCALEMWIWSTGETVCYDKWAPGEQPGMGECRGWQGGRTGAVQKEGKWVSRPENEKLNFICATKEVL